MAYYVPSTEVYGYCHLIESVIYVYIMIILKMNNKMISKLNISLVNKLMLVNSWCRYNILVHFNNDHVLFALILRQKKNVSVKYRKHILSPEIKRPFN